MLEPLTGDTMRQAEGTPLEDAKNYIRQALGVLMEVSDARGEVEKLKQEIHLLRAAIVRFGDRARMATVEPSPLQQVIDRALEARSS